MQVRGFVFEVWIALLLLGAGACGPAPDPGGTPGETPSDGRITVSYWRHHAEPELRALEEMIQGFEAQHPSIRIDLRSFPYSVYRTKLLATLNAGQGPDIINIHNSWAYGYIASGLIVPVPDGLFADGELASAFFPLARSFAHEGVYYAVPLGASNLGLFYNRRLFREAGLDPDRPPRTWSELRAMALRLTRRDRNGRLLQAGASIGSAHGQGWNYFVEGVLRQHGVRLLADDQRSVRWNDERGVAALRWFTGFMKGEAAVNSVMFPGAGDAFRLGLSAMTIDGSWRIGVLARTAPNLDYDTAVVPASDGGFRATYGTAWGNAVTGKSSDPVREAAWKLIEFLASYPNMKLWSRHTGELPMRRRAATDPNFRARAGKLIPFLDQMTYSHASLKKDEAVYKAAIVEAVDRVLLRDVDPETALAAAATRVDAMLRME